MLTLQGAMPRKPGFKQTLCADIDGFSLRSAVRCAADDRHAPFTGPWAGAASDPMLLNRHRSGDPATDTAGVGCAQGFPDQRERPGEKR